MKIQSHKDLIVWEKSMQLVELVYKICSQLPKSETYGLQSQLKRSAISIPSNIAEGKMRSTRKDYANFLHNSLGSSAELEIQLILTKKLFSLSVEECINLNTELQKMLFKLIGSLKPKT
jgi:four helix bundle protein